MSDSHGVTYGARLDALAIRHTRTETPREKLLLIIVYELACKCLTSQAGVGPLYTSAVYYTFIRTTTCKHWGGGGPVHIGVPVDLQ